MIYAMLILLSYSNNTISKVIWVPFLILVFSLRIFSKKEAIKETRLDKIVSNSQVILNALKCVAYAAALAVMYVQFKHGSSNEKIAQALLVLLITLGAVEIMQSVIRIIDERNEGLKKAVTSLVFILLFAGVGFIWIRWFFKT